MRREENGKQLVQANPWGSLFSRSSLDDIRANPYQQHCSRDTSSRKAVATFLLVGLSVGVLAAYVITRESLAPVFFQLLDHWKAPTWNYWGAVGESFSLTLIVGYILPSQFGWLRRLEAKAIVLRELFALGIILAAPVALVAVGVRIEKSVGPCILFTGAFLVLPTYGVAVVWLVLYVLTNVVDRLSLCLMMVLGVFVYSIANVVFIPLDLLNLGNEGFHYSEIATIDSGFAGLCGFWLVRAGAPAEDAGQS